MANTFSQMYAHIIFSPKGRQSLILPTFEEQLYKYITAIVQNKGQKMIAIHGMPDHIHLFIGFKPTVALSDLVRDIKASSSKFINEERFISNRFSWQEGFGCFTYAHSQVDAVAKYVMNQKVHHRKKTFQNEYIELLRIFAISYDQRFLFKFFD